MPSNPAVNRLNFRPSVDLDHQPPQAARYVTSGAPPRRDSVSNLAVLQNAGDHFPGYRVDFHGLEEGLFSVYQKRGLYGQRPLVTLQPAVDRRSQSFETMSVPLFPII